MFKLRHAGRAGFTWLEMLIVIGIIGVLAWLAQPNLCMVSTPRSNTSRAKADMRTVAVALESYYTDYKAYPGMQPLRAGDYDLKALRGMGGWDLTEMAPGRRDGRIGLTTPVAYIPNMFPDPFARQSVRKQAHAERRQSNANQWAFTYFASPDHAGWIMWSPGPDLDYDIRDAAELYDPLKQVPSDALIGLTYDPTNGAESNGDVWRTHQ